MAVTNSNSKSELCQMEDDVAVKANTRKQLIQTVVCAVSVLVCIGLAVALIVVIISDTTDMEEYCNTGHCAMMAGDMIERMDLDVNPCEDFYQYACGRWENARVIPDDRSSFTTFSELRDNLDIKLKALVDQPVISSDIKPTVNVKNNYIACIDLATIETRASQPLVNLMSQLGGWPVLSNNPGGNWSEADFNLEDQLSTLRGSYSNSMIYYTYVSTDNKDSSKYILKLDQPSLGLPSRDYYLDKEKQKFINAYHDYMTTIAVMLGAEQASAKQQMNDVIGFETRIANFDWLRYYRGLNASWSDNITTSEYIVVHEPKYVADVNILTNYTDKRIIANYLMWRITMNRISQLSSDFRKVKLAFDTIVYGTASEGARWQSCVNHVNDVMGMATGRMFVDVHYDVESKDRTNVMINYLQTAFLQLVDESEWMDKQTQGVAKEKAQAMRRKIGYPDWIKVDDQLIEYYKNYDFISNKYFENYLQYLRESTRRSFDYLRENVNKEEWGTFPAIVNAYYSSSSNSITFPAGILQPLFYHKESPEYLNFGGIGMVIGHEITHGFDDRGRQYDKDGNLEQWWSDESVKKFKYSAKCIVDQYDDYYMSESNMT
uniref:LOW QUALITY PROTEIN: membrane metallo-endopeptidase-like 1-like n=1 Tax=Saccoglossus kowalevskii TaxID=10224 RepID=A0ABM0MQX2_SACKO